MPEPRTIGEIMEEMLSELKRLNESIELSKSDILLTTTEAADYLGRTRQTIAVYQRKGLLHRVARGGKAGYLKSELDRTREL